MNDFKLNAFITPDKEVNLTYEVDSKVLSGKRHTIEKELYDRFQSNRETWLFSLGFYDKKILLSPSIEFFREISTLFWDYFCKSADLESLRDRFQLLLPEDDLSHLLDSAPAMPGSEYIDVDMISSLWESLHHIYVRRIQTFNGSMEAFIQSLEPNSQIMGRIFFHLVENRSDEVPFAFMATYSTDGDGNGNIRHLPLKSALKQYENDTDQLVELLKTVYSASESSELIYDLIESGELFHPLAWDADEAFGFLKEVPLYEASGILCRIPDWWKARSKGPTLEVRFGETEPVFVGMQALLDFDPRIYLGDVEISHEEAIQLLEEAEGLAFIKNKWVAVDHEKLKQTLEAYEKAKAMLGEGISIKDALFMQLNRTSDLDEIDSGVDISLSNGDWLEAVTQKLCRPELIMEVRPASGFKACLRGYQKKGFNWLTFMHSLNFGACLADDMGLGKTVQLIAFLSFLKSLKLKKKASILVLPASLISNWVSEIDRFFPKLSFYIAHPGAHFGKKIEEKSSSIIDQYDLVITTYALVNRYEWLRKHPWRYAILDEAQAIKNPGTKQTKAVKELISENRIILTGTPVENKLFDVWSLFDFLNPGLLGNKKEFTQFSKNLKDDTGGYKRLRKLISPYILRRLKTDKKVISDLPEKVEMKTYADLSKRQIVLYKDLVDILEKSIEASEGIQRKGLILSSLIKFKQLCNHPDQYLGTGHYLAKESGKFLRLKEICETIYEKRERVLIFTQFKEVTKVLHDYLSSIFYQAGLIIHGSVSVGKRKKMIEAFQGKDYIPFMVLSLKAGGVGLNLTKANHVIHFDRWWNPAVENQATDRVFRIGQKKNVVVHKFITKGTIEEKIDRMIETKKDLSDKIVQKSKEFWITEMKNDALMDMFSLSL